MITRDQAVRWIQDEATQEFIKVMEEDLFKLEHGSCHEEFARDTIAYTIRVGKHQAVSEYLLKLKESDLEEIFGELGGDDE